MKTSHSRKANAVLDTVTIIVGLLVFAVISIVSWQTWGNVKPDLDSEINDSLANETITYVNSNMPSMLDNAFVMIFVGLWIVAIILAFIIDAHPIFMVFAFILLVFVSLISLYIANYYEEFITTDGLDTFAASFPMTNWIFSHLLLVCIVVGASIMVALYAKVQT